MIGCGEGGLKESEVLNITTTSLKGSKFDVEIYTSRVSSIIESSKESTKSE